MRFLLITGLLFCFAAAGAQEVDLRKPDWMRPADSLSKKRIAAVAGSTAGLYTGALIGLNYLWYAQFERQSFHWFNDAKEWQQVDKVGHLYAAYFQTDWYYHLLRWSGVNNRKATWAAAATAWTMQATIEVLDGFSAEWGASATDLAFNTAGNALFVVQQLSWKEQRIRMKTSWHSYDYPAGELRDRARSLYGSNILESFLKDYNQNVNWLSFNIASFNPKQQRAKWLNIALGYGAGGMYGGFENVWRVDGNIEPIDRTDIKRYRRFFLSLDMDLSRIQARTRTGQFFLGMFNILKMPFPALEVNTKGQIAFHPIFGFDLSDPLYLKK